MFEKIYELPLSRGYVRHWGVVEAVRELCQNALDSDSPFEYEYGREDDTADFYLRIISRNAKLDPKTLLLGQTSKADAKDKIGSFGEGYKIALLVLTREGRPVVVANNDRLWSPSFRYSRQFDEEILCIHDRPYERGRGQGVIFQIEGLSSQDIDGILESNLHMQESVGQTLETHWGRILLDRPGKLYVNGLYVCKTELKFGYDIKPAYLKLERDRQTVSSFDLQFLAKDMWFSTRQLDKVAELIEQNAPDMHYANYGTPEMVKEACYRLFMKNHPGAVVAESQAELQRLVAQGMERVVVVHKTYSDIIKTTPSYFNRAHVQVRSPSQLLGDWFAENRKHMRHRGVKAFATLLEQSANWKLK